MNAGGVLNTCKSNEALYLISFGTEDFVTEWRTGEYTLGDQDVTVKGTLATLHDGTIAGSATNLYDCMMNAVSMGIPLESAIKAATINPAKSIGIDNIVGSIEPGKRADILCMGDCPRVVK